MFPAFKQIPVNRAASGKIPGTSTKKRTCPSALASGSHPLYHSVIMNDSPSSSEASTTAGRVRWWKSIGPGIIIASVAFGPGSLLTSSRIGSLYGYDLLWLLVLTATLMGSFLLMAARVGMHAPATPCQMVAERWGRPWAVLIGLVVCGIASSFQFGNNVAVATALKQMGVPGVFTDNWLLPLLNGAVIVFLFAFKQIYKWIERIAMLLVGIMLAAFAYNLIVEVHPPLHLFKGLMPSWPEGITLRWPRLEEGGIVDPLHLLAGFVGTTFVVAGAFLQASLVREKGWSTTDFRRGLSDMLASVCALAAISAMIMVTAGTVLRGQDPRSVADLAMQLEPAFGDVAHALFCLGMLAAALSSVLVNAMVAGLILSDGLGLGAKMEDRGPRLLTVMALLIGMAMAMLVIKARFEAVTAIIFAQGLTVLGNPLMVIALLWAANSRRFMKQRRNGLFLNIMGVIGFVTVTFLAVRVAYLLYLRFQLWAS